VGQDVFAGKYMYEKLTKFLNFMLFAQKINKTPEFYVICPKRPEFNIIARKIFFPNVGGEHVPPAPVTYAYDVNTILITVYTRA